MQRLLCFLLAASLATSAFARKPEPVVTLSSEKLAQIKPAMEAAVAKQRNKEEK